MPIVTQIKIIITPLCLHFVNSTCQITNIYRDMKSPTASKLGELERQTTDEDLDCLICCTKLPAFLQSQKCQGRQSFHWHRVVSHGF